jgi:hypothetical protein
MKSPEVVIAPIFCVGSTRMAELGHKHASWPSRIDENIGPSSGVKLPPDTASTTTPTALATSAAVWTGGRTMLTGQPCPMKFRHLREGGFNRIFHIQLHAGQFALGLCSFKGGPLVLNPGSHSLTVNLDGGLI